VGNGPQRNKSSRCTNEGGKPAAPKTAREKVDKVREEGGNQEPGKSQISEERNGKKYLVENNPGGKNLAENPNSGRPSRGSASGGALKKAHGRGE